MDEELLVAVADRPIGQVRAALREAIDHRILVATSHSRRLGFRHALVREVAADELLAGEQAGLHERLAMVLSARPELAEASPAGAAAELAYHWEAAGRSAEALAAAIEAGAAAARVAAWADADRQYQRALRLIDRTDQLPDGIDRIELLRRSGEAAELDGEPARAQGIIEQALGEIDAGVDAVRAGLLQGRLGYLRWVQGDNDAALAAHLRAVELVPAEPSSAARARVLASLGGALLGFGRYDDSRLTCEEAIRCAQAVGARSEEARARNMLGSDLVALGDVEGGLAELERSRDLAIAAGPSDMRVVGHYNLAVNLALAGRLRDAEVAARQGAEAARTEGLQRRYGMDLAALEGDVLMRLGRWADANRVIDEGIGLDPNGRGTIYLAIVRGRLDALRGDTDAARSWFGIAEDLAAGQMDADLAGFLARAQAELALVDERPQDALRICVDGIAPLAGTNDHFVRSPLLALAIQSAAELAEGARVAQDAAQLARARATAEPLVEELRGMAVREGGPMISALAGVAEAEWSRLIGEPADALWSAAAPALEAISDPYAVAYVSYRRAESELRRRGVRADVSDSLRSAALLAAGLGARPLLRSVEHLARRARVHLAEQTRTGPAADDRSRPSRSTNSLVSARELEVLRLVAAGRTNGEIADELFISRKTASVHVTHILDKLGVANRVEAAMAATRLGLLNDEWSTPAPHRRRRPPAS